MTSQNQPTVANEMPGQLQISLSLQKTLIISAWGAMLCGLSFYTGFSFLSVGYWLLFIYAIGHLPVCWGFFQLGKSLHLPGVRGGSVALALSVIPLYFMILGHQTVLFTASQYLLRLIGLAFIFVNLWPLHTVLNSRFTKLVVISQLAVFSCKTLSLLPDWLQEFSEGVCWGLVAWLFFMIAQSGTEPTAHNVVYLTDEQLVGQTKPVLGLPKLPRTFSVKKVLLLTSAVVAVGILSIVWARWDSYTGTAAEADSFASAFTTQFVEASYGDDASSPTYKLRKWSYQDGYYTLDLDARWVGDCCNFLMHKKCEVEMDMTVEVERTGRIRSKTINHKNDCAKLHEMAGATFNALKKIYSLQAGATTEK